MYSDGLHLNDDTDLYIPVAEINLNVVGERWKMEIHVDVVKYEFRIWILAVRTMEKL